MTRKNSKAASGAGTIRQRKDGRWEARYTIGRDPGTGKQIQKSIYGATQKEVRQKLQQVCTSIDNGTYNEPSKMTVSEWLDIWISEYVGNVKQLTDRSYNDIARLHIKPAIGILKLNALNTHTIHYSKNV